MDDGVLSPSFRPDGKRYFTNADMARLVEAGLIDPEARWELIRGEWFDMGSEGFEHMDVRTRLIREMILQIGRREDVLVSTEGSIFLSHDTEVRPDLIIYRADVGTNEMTGTDILLVIEVMKSSLRRDMELKRPVYAAAGVPELWLIDLDQACVHVCRDPDPTAETYREETRHGADARLSPQHFPDVQLSLTDLRPPR